MIFKIYSIINIVNRKIYIGKTSKTIEQRWQSHVDNANCNQRFYFYRAIRKYGPELFKVEEIAAVDSEEMANVIEKFYIHYTKSYNKNFGYNGTMGGEGVIPNDETRKKLRQAQLGKKRSLEARKKQSKTLTGQPRPNMVGRKCPKGSDAAKKRELEKFLKTVAWG